MRGLTDSGAEIFGSALLNHRNSGRNAFGGSVPFPRSVWVTWREGVTEGEYWTTGTVVGDHTIDVAARVPDAVFAMASSKRNRFVKLQFRVKNSAVLFAWSVDESLRSDTPFVVEYSLAPGAKNKNGVLAVTNTGARLFASSTLNPLNRGKSSFGGTVLFPTWVRITWREGVTAGEYWTSGTVVADQTIDVSSRIPASFFEAAAAGPLRVIKLQFRIKDDKVLFAWCVQQTSTIGSGYLEILNDGDFKDPTKFNGVITDPGWER